MRTTRTNCKFGTQEAIEDLIEITVTTKTDVVGALTTLTVMIGAVGLALLKALGKESSTGEKQS